MKNNRFHFLIPVIVFVLFSCKDEGVVPEQKCNEVLDGWIITSDDFPMVQKQYDLFFPEDPIGFSVGNRGTILKTSNGGQDWQLMEYYYTTETGFNENVLTKANLKTIYFINDLIGFAGGEGEFDFFDHTHTDAVFLKTGDGGNNWRKIYLEGVYTIYDLIFFDKDHGMGLFRIHNSDNSSEIQIRSTHDGGEEWTEIVLPVSQIDSYQFITTTSRIIVLAEDNSDNPLLLSTNDNGLNWQSQHLPQGPCGRIYFINDEIGFANCPPKDLPMGIYQTKDGGNSWEEINSPLNDWSLVHFNTPEEGFIINPIYEVVEDPIEPYAVLSLYEVFQTVDGGKEWKKNKISKECNFIGINYSPSHNFLYSLGSTINRFEKR